MNNWIFLGLIYGIISGIYFLFQKQAMKISHSIEVFVSYVTISFILVFLNFPDLLSIEPKYLLLISLKSLVMLISFILSFKAMSKLSVSLYGVINMSRILFTTLLGIIILNETIGKYKIIGMILICLGLLLVNSYKEEDKKSDKKYILILFIGCIFASFGGLLDKIISLNVNPSDFQWCFLLFLFLYSWLYVLVRKIKINFKKTFKNSWIYLYSIMVVVADRILFSANSIPESEISIISLLKQISIVIMILGGGIIFKEKNLKYKLICSLVILMGLLVIVIGGKYE